MVISSTFASKGSKPKILKDANLIILRINEPICGSHENSTSSKSETPNLILQFISPSFLPHLMP
jgi:hypothetical protein